MEIEKWQSIEEDTLKLEFPQTAHSMTNLEVTRWSLGLPLARRGCRGRIGQKDGVPGRLFLTRSGANARRFVVKIRQVSA
jgi:hypothetical protein